MTKEQCIKIYEESLSDFNNRDYMFYDSLKCSNLKSSLKIAIEKENLSVEDIQASIQKLLLGTLNNNDHEFVESALELLEIVGKPDKYIDILCKLIVDENHKRHEDVALALQREKDANTIPFLFQAAQTKYEYLKWDEENALARKCLWALGDINTKESWEKINELKNAKDESVSKWAKEQLNRKMLFKK